MRIFEDLQAVCVESDGMARSVTTRRKSRIVPVAVLSVLAVGVLGWMPTTASADVTPQADYQFQETLASIVGTPPALTDLGPGENTFATESLNGSSQTVLRFWIDNGVQLTPTTGVIQNGVYTIAVLFRLATVTNGDQWQRLVDFKDGTTDNGLYVHQGALEFYPYARGAGATIEAERYTLVVLTRDSSGVVTGYVNGAEQFSFDDSSVTDAVIDSNDVLRFFRDNDSGPFQGEASAGAVARIQLYDEALTSEQVASLLGGSGGGTSSPGTASANVESMSFSSQLLDTLSAPQALVVTNTGDRALAIDRARMMGAERDDFLLSSDECSGDTLRAGESCAIGVRFAPSASGERAATLSVSSTDPRSPLEIPVSGIGGQSPPWQPESDGGQGVLGTRGSADGIEVVRCTTIVRMLKPTRHTHMKCTTGLLVGPVNLTPSPAATTAVLSRGRLVYATGSVRGSGASIRLLLSPRRSIARGTYTLTVTRRHQRRRETVAID